MIIKSVLRWIFRIVLFPIVLALKLISLRGLFGIFIRWGLMLFVYVQAVEIGALFIDWPDTVGLYNIYNSIYVVGTFGVFWGIVTGFDLGTRMVWFADYLLELYQDLIYWTEGVYFGPFRHLHKIPTRTLPRKKAKKVYSIEDVLERENVNLNGVFRI